jgi:hypothetical protein
VPAPVDGRWQDRRVLHSEGVTVVRSKSVQLQVALLFVVFLVAMLDQMLQPASSAYDTWVGLLIIVIAAVPFLRLILGGVRVSGSKVSVRNAWRTRACRPTDVVDVVWTRDLIWRDVAALRLTDGRTYRVSLLSPSKIKGRAGMEHLLSHLREALIVHGAPIGP